MRSFHLLAALVAALVIGSSAAQAGNVVRYTDGSLGVEGPHKEVAERLDITVKPDALAYGDAWEKAVKTGKPVPVETHEEYSTHHFTLTTVTVASKEVVLKRGAVVVANVSTTLRTEESLNPFFVFAGIAVALIALANLLFLARDSIAIIFAFLATFATFATFATAAATVTVAIAVAFFATFFVTLTSFAIGGTMEARAHKGASAVFYGAMTLAALTVYF